MLKAGSPAGDAGEGLGSGGSHLGVSPSRFTAEQAAGKRLRVGSKVPLPACRGGRIVS